MRNIVDVMNKMKPYIIDNEEVLVAFNYIEEDFYWKAPETHYLLWDELGDVLNKHYPLPLQNDEHVKIISIFTAMTEDEVREKFTSQERVN
jgi:hypothetical protein